MVNNQDFVVNEAVLKGQPFFIKRGSEGDMKSIDILKNSLLRNQEGSL